MRLPTFIGLLLNLAPISPAQVPKAQIEASEAAYRTAMLKEDIGWFEKNLATDYVELDQGRTFNRAKALQMLRNAFRDSHYRSYISTPFRIEAKGQTATSMTQTTFVIEGTRPKPRRLPTTEIRAQLRKTWNRKNGRWQLSRLEVLKLISIKALKV